MRWLISLAVSSLFAVSLLLIGAHADDIFIFGFLVVIGLAILICPWVFLARAWDEAKFLREAASMWMRVADDAKAQLKELLGPDDEDDEDEDEWEEESNSYTQRWKRE